MRIRKYLVRLHRCVQEQDGEKHLPKQQQSKRRDIDFFVSEPQVQHLVSKGLAKERKKPQKIKGVTPIEWTFPFKNRIVENSLIKPRPEQPIISEK